VCDLQETLVKFWDPLEHTGDFVPAWLMLGEMERKRHVLKGLDEVCEHAPQGQDLRALCPEILLKLILKKQRRSRVLSVIIARGRSAWAGKLYISSQMNGRRRRWI
jgi:hypothetical protein